MMNLNLIDGAWCPAADGRTVDVVDPATDELISTVPLSAEVDVQAAVDAAARAQPAWARQTARERGKALQRLADLVVRDTPRIAEIITREQGKPLAEARGEIDYGLGFLQWAAEEATRVYGDIVPSWNSAKRILVMKQPVGVTAAITPWNFPFAMLTRKLGPALAVGCTQVIKPATQTPLTAIALCELAVEAGLPSGTVNLITGPGRVFSDVVFDDSRVRKVSFTGSTEVGQELIAKSAKNVVRLSLELGGHAPVIVLDDCDLDVAVTGALRAKFRNNGQSCIAANRFYVSRSIYAEFCDRFVDGVAKITVRPGINDGDVGPLIDDAAVRKVREHIDDAVARGATVAAGGKLADLGSPFSKRFFEPTVLIDVDERMLIASEETFGPVAALSVVDDDDEAILKANSSPFGLASYVFGRDMGRVMNVVERLEYGIVGVNDGLPSTAQVPFGGMKSSGIGREGGKYVMDEYLETKYVSLAL